MLSELPKLFDKNFVVGFLLPVVLGAYLLAVTFPGVTFLAPLLQTEFTEAALAKLSYLALLLWIVGIALTMTNTTQIRLLEGYLPPVSWMSFLKERKAKRLETLSEESARLKAAKKADKASFTAADQALLNRTVLELVTYYPPERLLLPTRFGNVLRAFESYPLTAYGADGVPVWLRLATVVPKEFSASVDDARSQVSCVVNLLYVMGGLAIASIGFSLWETPWRDLPLGQWERVHPHLLIGLAELAGAVLAYHAAIARAVAWGQLVKAAFDCYLPELARKLGYRPPHTDAQKRKFWGALAGLYVYHAPAKLDVWPPDEPPPAPAGPQARERAARPKAAATHKT